MENGNDAPAVLAARKIDVFVDQVPKEMHQLQTPTLRLQNNLPPHMDFTNTLLPQHRGRFILTINSIMSSNGVF